MWGRAPRSLCAMRGAGTRGLIGEVDSICAFPACTEGLTVKSVVGEINIFATAIVGMFFPRRFDWHRWEVRRLKEMAANGELSPPPAMSVNGCEILQLLRVQAFASRWHHAFHGRDDRGQSRSRLCLW